MAIIPAARRAVPGRRGRSAIRTKLLKDGHIDSPVIGLPAEPVFDGHTASAFWC